MLSLFQIENELRELFDSVGEEVEQSAVIATISSALAEKTDQVAYFHESLENYVSLLEAKISELQERKKQVESKIERFDEYVLNCMAINGRDSFEGSLCKIKKRKPSLAVEIVDETKIPIEFIKIPEPKPTIMKAEISKLLKQGEVIEGARLVEGKISIMYSIK